MIQTHNKKIETSPNYITNSEIMTEKGMSFSFRYDTQEKPYKVLQNLEKKTKQKKMTSL